MKKGNNVSNEQKLLIRRKERVKVITGLVLFAVSFLLTLYFLVQPLPDEQFAICEKVAENTAMRLHDNVTLGTFWMDITSDFSVCVTFRKDSVIVFPCRSNNYFGFANVVAKFENGALGLKRRDGVPIVIFVSLLFGFVCSLIGSILVSKFTKPLRTDVTD